MRRAFALCVFRLSALQPVDFADRLGKQLICVDAGEGLDHGGQLRQRLGGDVRRLPCQKRNILRDLLSLSLLVLFYQVCGRYAIFSYI